MRESISLISDMDYYLVYYFWKIEQSLKWEKRNARHSTFFTKQIKRDAIVAYKYYAN